MEHETRIVEGWTEPLTYQLFNEEPGQDAVIADLSGKTVTLTISGCEGTLVTTVGKVLVTDAVNGKVQFTPVTNDFKAAKSPYRARFTVVYLTTVVFYPNKDTFKIVVDPVV